MTELATANPAAEEEEHLPAAVDHGEAAVLYKADAPMAEVPTANTALREENLPAAVVHGVEEADARMAELATANRAAEEEEHLPAAVDLGGEAQVQYEAD